MLPKLTSPVRQKINVRAQKMLESTKKFTGERLELRMFFSEPEPKIPNNYSST